MTAPDDPSSGVSRVRTRSITLPLPVPLQLGSLTIKDREYTAVQVTTRDGLVGKAYCLSRDAPMAEIVERLVAPHVLGQDSDNVAETWDVALRGSALVGRVGLVRRALGLVDIALWDIAAQRAGMALWQLIGSDPTPRDVMLVAAYPTPDRTVDETAAEVLVHARDGWPLIKIARSPDRVLMRELLARVRAGLPSHVGIVVDASFAWRSADEALSDLEAWGTPDLAWLEDPLLPEDAEGCARIRREGGVRVGVGDEVTDPRVIHALIDADAVDVVRVDVVAIGGVTPAMELIRQVHERNIPMSCHVYPEVSVHLGVGVETFHRGQEGNRYDPSCLLVTGGPEFTGGHATAPTTPGLGFDLEPVVWGLPARREALS